LSRAHGHRSMALITPNRDRLFFPRRGIAGPPGVPPARRWRGASSSHDFEPDVSEPGVDPFDTHLGIVGPCTVIDRSSTSRPSKTPSSNHDSIPLGKHRQPSTTYSNTPTKKRKQSC